MTRFDDAFTAFVRARGLWRDNTPGSLLERWASFVEECEHGYRDDEFAYGNEAMSRTTIEAALRQPSLADFPRWRSSGAGSRDRRPVPAAARRARLPRDRP